jgi:hypothetical protein
MVAGRLIENTRAARALGVRPVEQVGGTEERRADETE